MIEYLPVLPKQTSVVVKWLLQQVERRRHENDKYATGEILVPERHLPFLHQLETRRMVSEGQARKVAVLARDAANKLQLTEKEFWKEVERLTPGSAEPETKPDKAPQNFTELKFKLLDRLAVDKTLTRSQFRVLHHLMIAVWSDDKIRKSLTAIARDTALHKQTVMQALSELRFKDRLDWEVTQGGNTKTNVYTGIIVSAKAIYIQQKPSQATADDKKPTVDDIQQKPSQATADDVQQKPSQATTHHSEDPHRGKKNHSRGAYASATPFGASRRAADEEEGRRYSSPPSGEGHDRATGDGFDAEHAARHKSAPGGEADGNSHNKGSAPRPAAVVAYEKHRIDVWSMRRAGKFDRPEPNDADVEWATVLVTRWINDAKYGYYGDPPEYANIDPDEWQNWEDSDIEEWWEERCKDYLAEENIVV